MFLNKTRIRKVHIIIIIIISLPPFKMYWNYINVAETNPVSTEHKFAGISWLQFMENVMLFLSINVCTLY